MFRSRIARSRSGRSVARIGAIEQLESRVALSATGGATVSPPAGAASFSTGVAEAAADRTWISAAGEGTDGTVVIWLRIDVNGGVPAIQALPIAGRLNLPDAVDPAMSGDASAVFSGMSIAVFGGSGTAAGAEWPMTLDAFAASPPEWHEGTQDYFVVVRSPSDLALQAMTAAFVVAAAPGLPAAAATDGADGITTSTTDAGPSLPAGITRLFPSVSRPVPAEGLLPDDANAAAWLQDARDGSDGAFVLWISPADDGQLPRLTPLFARFNPPTDQDPAFGPPENHQSSARFHPADGSDPFDVPTGSSSSGSWSDLVGDRPSSGFLVVHTDSNFEIAIGAIFSLLVQMPSAWLDESGGDPGIGASLSGLVGVGGPPPAPVVTLAHDTGESATDLVTGDGTLTVTAAVGATVQYSSDGGRRWAAGYAPHQGVNRVLVRQVDALGRESPTTSFAFTFDTRPPKAPRVGFADGTAADRNPLRRRADLAVRGVESGGRVEYSAKGGPWTASWAAVEGQNAIRVRQVDVAGNASAASPALLFQIKTRVKSPNVALARDTGRSASDRITADPRLAIRGVELGAVVWYSVDGGGSWKTSFKAVEGRNVVLVRQVDRVGNISSPTPFDFTLDRTPPRPPDVSPTRSTGLPAPSLVALQGVENGTRIQYSLDGRTWTPSTTASHGRGLFRLFVRAVDDAGNTSAAAVVRLR